MHLRVASASLFVAVTPLVADAVPASPGAPRAAVAPSETVRYVGGPHRALASRDCRPYNGPYGYFGNPWCEGGFKYEEDWNDGRGIIIWTWPEDPDRYRWRKRRY
jgi:hypothetical protein